MANIEKDQSGLAAIAKSGSKLAGMIVAGAGVVAAGSVSALEITNFGVTVGVGDTFDFDLDGDTIDDFSIVVQLKLKKGPKEIIDADPTSFEVATISALDGGTIFAAGISAPFVQVFSEGDTIDGTSGFEESSAVIYDDSEDGGLEASPFLNVGDTGFIGLALNDDGLQTFGWLEITRGSVIVGQGGFQPGGGGALIPQNGVVPAPPALLLLATGAIGLAAAARRRKKSKAA